MTVAMSQEKTQTNNPYYVAVKPQYGFIIPHAPAIRDISSTNPFGLEVETGWHLLKKKDWQRCNCYSRAGLSLLYSNYNNPDVLGSSINLLAFGEPFFNYNGFMLTSIRMGAGLSYLTRVYDKQTNPENKFFSSPLSFLVHIDLNALKYLDDHWFLHAYFKYNHISNGGSALPNKGMNFPTYGIGLGYSFQPVNFPDREKIKLEKPTPLILSGHLFGTMEPDGSDDGFWGRRPAIGLLIKGRKEISRINALNAAVELSANYAEKKRREQGVNPPDHRQVSFLIGHDFIFGNFIFSQYWGTYIFAPLYWQDFYQRYSLSYELMEDLRVGVTLKVHAQVAENFNLMFSYDLWEN